MTAGTDISDRRVTLHLGVQKTASTALHHFLARNAGALAQHLVVRTPVQGSPVQRMGRAAVVYTLDPTPQNEAGFGSLIREARDEIGPSDTPVLISHENLPGAMLGNPGVTTLYPMLERLIALLEENLAPWVPDFTFYTRAMPAWKKSVHNQAVKTDGYTETLSAFLKETAKSGSWAELEARVAAAVGQDRCAFFTLEDEVQDRPGLGLLAHAGVPRDVLDGLNPLAARPNESLNPGALEFMRRLNRAGLGPQPRMKVMKLVMNNQALFAPTLPDGTASEPRA